MGLAPVTVLIMLLWWFGTQFVVIALIVLMSIGSTGRGTARKRERVEAQSAPVGLHEVGQPHARETPARSRRLPRVARAASRF